MEQNIRVSALNLLARREHSRVEMQRKLLQRGYNLDEINITLDVLAKEGLQNEERFAENYTRSRFKRGFGPLHIHAELRIRGISEDLIKKVFIDAEMDWLTLAVNIRKKKFGVTQPKDIHDRAKQTNFLKYKGFRGEEIRYALGKDFDEYMEDE
ncbi:MAG: hypothetical protein A2X78_00340 [Gammaproteobacteria bacterium GWE2_37_16]|nr:MAG: hypothetical protein A2X78_00340 [Gammaproteobacteria bacterium GWE2_37_16]